MTTAFENFSIEKFDTPSRLELLAREVPDKCLDVQQLDRPIVLDQESSMVPAEGVESKHKLDDQAEEVRNATDSKTEEICPDRTIICRNESLAGDVHPVTGVPFERKIIEVDGEKIEGVFPQFESSHTVELPEQLHQASNKEQFDYANDKLREAVTNDPELRSQFTAEQLEQIENGDRPDGYVWHHAENPGELQLVDRDTHDRTGHTGGQVVWGGGSENR